MLDATAAIQPVVDKLRRPILGVLGLPEVSVAVVEVGGDQVFRSRLLGDPVRSDPGPASRGRSDHPARYLLLRERTRLSACDGHHRARSGAPRHLR